MKGDDRMTVEPHIGLVTSAKRLESPFMINYAYTVILYAVDNGKNMNTINAGDQLFDMSFILCQNAR